MAGRDLESLLQSLLELILRERECAKGFDMDGLQDATAEKEALLAELAPVTAMPPRLQPLAKRIKDENRRNAYLCWSTLRFVRESMAFFNRKVTLPAYGSGGQAVQTTSSGLLLAGRI